MLTTPTLETARLLLRPVASTDHAALDALHRDAEVLRFWDSPPWREPGRAARFVAASRRMAEDDAGVRLAIERREDAAFVGWCALSRWSPEHRSAAITFILAREAWGRGLATEAGRALLGWGYATLPLHRVQGEVDTRNAASARVLEHLGFQREGTLRQDCVVDGVVSDSWVYGLLRPEWEARRAQPSRSAATSAEA